MGYDLFINPTSLYPTSPQHIHLSPIFYHVIGFLSLIGHIQLL